MERTVGVTEARSRFAELVDEVRYKGDTVILTKSGKSAAVLVPVELFEQWKAKRKGVLSSMREIQANVSDDLSEDEAMALALQAQREVRAKQEHT